MVKKAIIGIIAVGLIAGATWYAIPAKVNAPAKPQWNCNAGQPACIELVNSKGVEIDRFNDFRFLPNHCIAYDSVTWKTYCGQFTLKWIGPVKHSKTNTTAI